MLEERIIIIYIDSVICYGLLHDHYSHYAIYVIYEASVSTSNSNIDV